MPIDREKMDAAIRGTASDSWPTVLEQDRAIYRAGYLAALTDAVEAVDDAGGDNTTYHVDAIVALRDRLEKEE